MKNFLDDLSEIGGQSSPLRLDVKIVSAPQPEQEQIEASYDTKKEIEKLKGFFLSFEDQKRYLILFSLPVYSN